MLARAILAVVLLPGIVAAVIPLAIAWPDRSQWESHEFGFIPVVLGVLLLGWCVREFYLAGKGTLAPWSPPQHLVVSGPYRLCRNPMYVAVALLLLGWAALFWSGALLIYALVVVIAFHLRVRYGEEPRLAGTFGPAWESYRRRTRRWPIRIGRN
jgi:protein-S-isoprenylcysteine O-methyltransferase Ste14